MCPEILTWVCSVQQWSILDKLNGKSSLSFGAALRWDIPNVSEKTCTRMCPEILTWVCSVQQWSILDKLNGKSSLSFGAAFCESEKRI